MALVEGTNCGFVLAAPSVDPEQSNRYAVSGFIRAIKFTSPADIQRIIEMGWWCDLGTVENLITEWGIYDHDAGNDRPGNLLFSSSELITLNDEIWAVKSGLNWALSENTIYWLAAVVEAHVADTISLGTDFIAYRSVVKVGSSLPHPFGVPAATSTTRLYGIYTLYEGAPPPPPPYPISSIKKGRISGYHCFMGAYMSAKVLGYTPLKLPDETVF